MKTIVGSFEGFPAERRDGARQRRLDGSDTVPMKRAARRDEDRAEHVRRLFERYRTALMRYVSGLVGRRAEAEDIVQETYTRLLAVPELDRSDGRARAYMFKVATHLVYDRFRRPREQSLDELGDNEPSSETHSPETIVGIADGLDVIGETLLRLKPRCRQVFLLRAAEGMSYEAIAETLGVSKRTVEREMKHALDACQRRLGRLEQ